MGGYAEVYSSGNNVFVSRVIFRFPPKKRTRLLYGFSGRKSKTETSFGGPLSQTDFHLLFSTTSVT